MIIQSLGWAALLFGVWSTISLGKKSRYGWALSAVSCVVWLAVNVAMGLWSGLAYSLIGIYLARRNWKKWQNEEAQSAEEA